MESSCANLPLLSIIHIIYSLVNSPTLNYIFYDTLSKYM
jgi:hypothetical protein